MSDSEAPIAKAGRKVPTRQQDPEGTRQNIIEVASQEFALNGLSGARIDEIAAKTRSSKRMIYYYFGDKEGLYLSALENAYAEVREGEAKLDIAGLSPVEGLKRLVEFTFEHHHPHGDDRKHPPRRIPRPLQPRARPQRDSDRPYPRSL
jgi:AcrR family transcriptional regulator